MKIIFNEQESSVIRKLQYDEGSKTLVVVIDNQSYDVYVYQDVPKEIVVGFVNHESKGKFYNNKLKGKGGAKSADVDRFTSDL